MTDYAATLRVEQPSEAMLDAMEDALDALPEAVMEGGAGVGWATVTFTVRGAHVLNATTRAAVAINRSGLPHDLDNVRLTIAAHDKPDADRASLGSHGVAAHRRLARG